MNLRERLQEARDALRCAQHRLEVGDGSEADVHAAQRGVERAMLAYRSSMAAMDDEGRMVAAVLIGSVQLLHDDSDVIDEREVNMKKTARDLFREQVPIDLEFSREALDIAAACVDGVAGTFQLGEFEIAHVAGRPVQHTDPEPRLQDWARLVGLSEQCSPNTRAVLDAAFRLHGLQPGPGFPWPAGESGLYVIRRPVLASAAATRPTPKGRPVRPKAEMTEAMLFALRMLHSAGGRHLRWWPGGIWTCDEVPMPGRLVRTASVKRLVEKGWIEDGVPTVADLRDRSFVMTREGKRAMLTHRDQSATTSDHSQPVQ